MNKKKSLHCQQFPKSLFMHAMNRQEHIHFLEITEALQPIFCNSLLSFIILFSMSLSTFPHTV